MTRRQVKVLGLAGVAVFLVSFDSSVIVLGLPAIAHELKSSVPALTGLGSALGLGSLAAVPLAILADRVGRRSLLAGAVAGFSAANLFSSVAPSLAFLAATRVVAVCFETVASSTAAALVIEEMPAARRGVAIAGLTLAAGAGTGLTTLLYPLVAPHWRLLYMLGGLGLVAALVLAIRLPESQAWLSSARLGPERHLSLRLLAAPPWRRRMLVAAAATSLGAMLYSPAGLLVALFASQQLGFGPPTISAVVLAAGAASIPAFAMGGAISDRLGRRPVSVALSALAAAFTALAFSGSGYAYWVGNITWSVLASASAPALGAWFGELFPTRARATSESVASATGALGGVIGFRLVGALQPHLGLGPALITMAAGALVSAGLLLLLPETRGERLPA